MVSKQWIYVQKFRNHWTTEINVMDVRDFPRFEFKMDLGRISHIATRPGNLAPDAAEFYWGSHARGAWVLEIERRMGHSFHSIIIHRAHLTHWRHEIVDIWQTTFPNGVWVWWGFGAHVLREKSVGVGHLEVRNGTQQDLNKMINFGSNSEGKNDRLHAFRCWNGE